MKYSVSLSARARRDLDRFQGRIYLRLQSAIEALADDPRPHGKRTGGCDLAETPFRGQHEFLFQTPARAAPAIAKRAAPMASKSAPSWSRRTAFSVCLQLRWYESAGC